MSSGRTSKTDILAPSSKADTSKPSSKADISRKPIARTRHLLSNMQGEYGYDGDWEIYNQSSVDEIGFPGQSISLLSTIHHLAPDTEQHIHSGYSTPREDEAELLTR